MLLKFEEKIFKFIIFKTIAEQQQKKIYKNLFEFVFCCFVLSSSIRRDSIKNTKWNENIIFKKLYRELNI